MRNFTKTIAAVSLLAPTGVYPLGIGDIKLHSALNQNLNAEIALFVSGNESASDIKVKLAPPEKFDEAGIPWSYFLSKIKFKPVVKSDGSVVVALSSNEVLTEPFLDFLLEVSWPQGNLYREFTVLVDPPATYSQAIIPVATQAVAAANTQPSTAPAELKPAANVAQTGSAQGVSEYGPTGRKDTLWKIANAVKPADASVEQMMMAIYEANPKAFYQPNVNALMAGQTLTVPKEDAVLKLSRRQARAEFYKQVRNWRGTVATTKEKPSDVAEASQLKLLAPVDSEVTQAMQVTPGAGTVANEVVDKPAESIAAEPKTADAVAQESEQATVKVSEENQQLMARLEKLEQQLAQMQKMLLLKDEQLAALQSGKSATDSAAEIQPQSDAAQKTVASEEIGKKPSQTAVAKAKPIQPVKPVQVRPEAKPKPKPEPKPEMQPVVPEVTASGMSPYYMIAAGIGTGLLGLFGWLLWRKRKLEEEQSAESMFAASSQIIMPTTDQELPIADDSTSYDVGTVGESSFLSEFTPSDFDAFETEQNEVDPISEADVYLAYGRYQQAEELIRQAIADQPERDECKLKLLEIFYANENKEAFTAYVTDLAESGKKDDAEFWAKVVEMGSEIIPDSPLLNESASDNIATFKETSDAKESKLDVPEETEVSAEQQETHLDESVDSLDLTGSAGDENTVVDSEQTDLQMEVFPASDSEETMAEKLPDTGRTGMDNSLDFDLNAFDASQPDVPEGDEASDLKEEIETVDFDLSSFDLDSPEDSMAADGSSAGQFDEFDFNLPDEALDKEAQGKEIESMESFDFSAEDEQSSLDDFDFKFDIDTPEIALHDEAAIEEDVQNQVSDLTDMDELETKIDMAKAYIDMGDADAAKDIAEEVLEKGNTDQKQEAQEIIDRLH